MEYFILGFLWIAFCVLHSALISVAFTKYLQRKLGNAYKFYRLFYNIFTIAPLIPIIIYSVSISQKPFFVWDGYLLPLKYIFLSIGILFFLLVVQYYSFSQILGIAHIKEGKSQILINDSGKLHSKGILGVVRHPFYAGLFPIMWTINLDLTMLIINIILSGYLIIGTKLEERKLVLEFGDEYREYQQRVSMLFPLKWIKTKFAI
jgi:methanethiol S-methyltransferase